MSEHWETEIGELLTELSGVQSELLDALHDKRRLLVANDHESLAAFSAREQALIERLQACHDRRQELLSRADADGMPADSIGLLTKQLPADTRGRVQDSIREAAERSRLLQHQSLTNWVLVQRSLLHLSQMIEIIATGGRPRPTYGNGSNGVQSGALVDRAA